MRISTNSCLCPFLVCLCFIQRCSGVSHHSPAKVPSKNQTKLANGETEVHHRPKRGWIWNQFFVLEEHMGPDPQYVGKVSVLSSKKFNWKKHFTQYILLLHVKNWTFFLLRDIAVFTLSCFQITLLPMFSFHLIKGNGSPYFKMSNRLYVHYN